MADMYEATFCWPEVDAKDVIVTGSFDQWSSSIHLTKTPSGFEGKVKLPWGGRVLYKFVVDGRWLTAQSQPQEPDGSGNINNVYECPSKPSPQASLDLPSETAVQGHDELGSSSATAVAVPPTEDATVDTAVPVSGAVENVIPDYAGNLGQAKDDVLLILTEPAQGVPDADKAILDQAHAAGTLGETKEDAPLVLTETVQELSEADKAIVDGTLAPEEVPPAFAERAQELREDENPKTDQNQAIVTPVAVPAIHAEQDAEVEQPPEPTDGSITNGSQAVQSNGWGTHAFVAYNPGTSLDRLEPEKVVTPTPMHHLDTSSTIPQNLQAEPTVQTRPQPVGEPELGVILPSDAEKKSAEDAKLPTTANFVPGETVSATSTEVAPAVLAQGVTVLPTPTGQDTLDLPSNPVVVDQEPANETAVKESLKDETAATLRDATDTAVPEDPSTVPEAARTPLTPNVESAPLETSGGTIPMTVDDAETVATAVKQDSTYSTSSESSEGAAEITEGKPVQTTVTAIKERAHSTVEGPSPAQVPELVNTQTTAQASDVTAEGKPVADSDPTTVIPDATKETTPSSEPAVNGHSAAAPIKSATSDLDGTAIPSTSSPAPSKSRKKRTSIFGRVKDLFSLEKKDKK